MQPWKTFRNDKPSNFVVQNILQYRFDQLFEPGSDDPGGLEQLTKKNVPLEKLIKNVEEPKVSRYYDIFWCSYNSLERTWMQFLMNKVGILHMYRVTLIKMAITVNMHNWLHVHETKLRFEVLSTVGTVNCVPSFHFWASFFSFLFQFFGYVFFFNFWNN